MNLKEFESMQRIHVFKEGDSKMVNKPTTVRFDNAASKGIEFLKKTNQGKFGESSTTQVLSYAIQLAIYDQIKDVVNNRLSWIVTFPGFNEEEIKALITNEELRNKLNPQEDPESDLDDPFGINSKEPTEKNKVEEKKTISEMLDEMLKKQSMD